MHTDLGAQKGVGAKKEPQVNAAVLPKQVQAQVDEAERLMQEQQETPEQVETHEPEQQPAPVQVSTAPAADEEVRREVEYWKQRHSTLEGKYKTEVPRYAENIRQMQEELAKLREQLNKQPPAEQPKSSPLVTEKDEQTFGSDLIDLARRVTRETMREVDAKFAAIERKLAEVLPSVQNIEHVRKEVAQTKEAAFFSALQTAVPTWQEVDKEQGWLQWLAEVDSLSGKTRQQLLDEAHQALDVTRVANIFNLYIGSKPQAPASGQEQLARQVAPSKSSRTSSAQQGRDTFTGKQYAYWTDPRRVHDTEPDKLQAMLGELEKAVNEGRVRW